MCTSLGYKDATGNTYFGRTLELTTDLPYLVAYFPAGYETVSQVPEHPALSLKSVHAVLAITMPDRLPKPDAPLAAGDLKVLEGLNDKGLTFSLLSYPSAAGPQKTVEATRAILSASDLGNWALGQFGTVAEVKAALADQPVMLQALALLGGVVSPFHYVVHDAGGAALVIEFDKGVMSVYDNPVGVMTNGPRFDWHLTNLDNYTFLTNVDRSSATFGDYKATQPDSGIATAGLPASNTSVGRFVRAVYYAQYAEKAATPDEAVCTLAHVMNNFDRPRGVTIDYPEQGGGHLEVEGLSDTGSAAYATEFTCWTSLSDLARRQFYIRDYKSLNFLRIDLDSLIGQNAPAIVPLQKLSGAAQDVTEFFVSKSS
ncbi:linear amide C-N hydrolase [Aureimonas fodinaquatilis]|uniref:Linear amide C-N hydrolase n=1 Tax=Aureimonas fodinaquatilis TaxID=2565783 RepID=A0A5B0DRC0_9HYPH|nr:linear amide C-N hydrolase [Aureimonas fodinaquatilis]KAA0969056.1 linear amide C-N hydrolase [Aureimonas fodinaquatilis]